MTKIKFTLLILLTCFFSFGQTENFSTQEIFENQKITTAKIIVGLQDNNLESILQYFDSSLYDIIQSKLESCILEIRKIRNSTKLSDVVVLRKDYHVFRYRYSDKTRDRFQIDFYLRTNNPNSKVIKIKTKTDEVLKKEYENRIKSTEIPPPPPESDWK